MRRLLALMIWCMILLVGAILVMFTPRSWQCPLADNWYSPPPKFSRQTASVSLANDFGTVETWTNDGFPLSHFEAVGNTGAVQDIAFSPDGSGTFVRSADGRIVLWDTKSGLVRQSYVTYTHYPIRSAYAPNGETLAINIAAFGSSVFLIDANSGKNLASLGNSAEIFTYAPDSKTLAVESNNSIKLWSIPSGKLLNTLTWLNGYTGTFNQVTLTSLSFSPDGLSLLAGTDDTAIVWDVPSGKTQLTLQTRPSGSVIDSRFIYTPDGKTIIKNSGDSIQVWDARSGKLRLFLEHSDVLITSIAVSPDSKTLVTLDTQATISWWDVDSGDLLRTVPTHYVALRNAVISPDGKNLLTFSATTSDGWDMQTGTHLYSIAENGVVAFTPDSKMLVSGGRYGLIRKWSAKTGALIAPMQAHHGNLIAFDYSPDGKTILTGSMDLNAALWDAQTGRVRQLLTGHINPVYALSFSPDGKTALTGSSDSARLWDIATGQVIFTLPIDSMAYVIYSPDGKLFATTGSNGIVRLWNVQSGSQIYQLKGAPGQGWGLKFTSDSRALMVSERDGTVIRWDVSSGCTTSAIPTLISATFVPIVYAPDGQTALRITPTNEIELWDLESSVIIRTLRGHNARVLYAVYSSDGKILLTEDTDLTAILWDVSTGAMLRTWKAGGEFGVTFIPDSNIILTGFGGPLNAQSKPYKKLLNASTGEIIRPLCPLVLGRRWIVAGVGLCTVAIAGVIWFMWRIMKAPVLAAKQN